MRQGQAVPRALGQGGITRQPTKTVCPALPAKHLSLHVILPEARFPRLEYLVCAETRRRLPPPGELLCCFPAVKTGPVSITQTWLREPRIEEETEEKQR